MLPIFLTNLICFVVGFLYPAYSTFKAVKSKSATHIHQWAIYWICYSVYCLLEKFLDIFFYFWMPFYNEFKVMLLFMMTSNQASGSMLLYATFIEPHLSENEQNIDVLIVRIKQEFLKLVAFVYLHANTLFNKMKSQAIIQLQTSLAGIIKEGFLTQTPKSVDTVDSLDEQFTIIDKNNGEFDVIPLMETDNEYDEEEIKYDYRPNITKRSRGRPKKKST